MLEPAARAAWELNTRMTRLKIDRNVGGKKPEWKFTKERGALVREKGKGGIDWWRYQTVILLPKLLPFAQEVKDKLGDVLVQEDKAPSHAYKNQVLVYNAAAIERLL